MRENTGNLIIQAGLRPVLVFALIFMAIVIMVGVSGAQTPRTGGPARGQAPRPALAVADRYAWQHGYRAGHTDGHARGKSDFNDGNPRDFSGSEAYDNANRTYNESMGTLAEYREGYRLGFEVGYQDGYFGRAATNSIPANIGRIVVATLNSTSGQPGSTPSTAGPPGPPRIGQWRGWSKRCASFAGASWSTWLGWSNGPGSRAQPDGSLCPRQYRDEDEAHFVDQHEIGPRRGSLHGGGS